MEVIRAYIRIMSLLLLLNGYGKIGVIVLSWFMIYEVES